MKIDDMIEALTEMRNRFGGSEEVAVVTTLGENDYILPEYAITGSFEDQDGNSFKCAFVGRGGGEEFTRKGIPHYEWNPKEDRIDEHNEGNTPMGLLRIKMNYIYPEDSDVNGVTDDEEHPNMPGFDKNDNSSVKWDIDVSTGRILNWREGTTAKTNYKIVDEFEYDFEGFHYGPYYVPDFMGIDDKSFGDYVCVTVDESGTIMNWSSERFELEHEENVRDAGEDD